jgi:hypothetical protein
MPLEQTKTRDPSQRPKAHLIARNLAIKWFLGDVFQSFLNRDAERA